jgi:NADH dehydrogenase [ubiquinone] 1 alpha subcomplex assembly factor 4
MGIIKRLINVVTSQFRDFNVEQRAFKAVSMDKPKPAPKFESNERDLEKILKGK